MQISKTKICQKNTKINSYYKKITKKHVFRSSLNIKTFFGRNSNAVKSQNWIAVCVYLLIAILKKRFELPQTLNEILHILSITVFEKMPFLQAFLQKHTRPPNCKQLLLFDL
jgi:hypothetical protein